MQKTIFYVYTLCFLRFCVFCFSCVCKFVEETQKSVYHMSSVESSTALAPFFSGSSVLESCLAGAFVRPCKFYVYDTCIQT